MTASGLDERKPPERTAHRAVIVGLGFGLALGAVAIGLVVTRSAPNPGHTYLAAVPGFAAVSRDGRTLTVFGVRGPCNEPLREQLLAVESGSRVSLTILVHGKRHTEAQLRHMICALDLTSIDGEPSATLRAPLGTRAVVQGLSGRHIPVYGGAQVATPTVLPKGCAPGPVQPVYDDLTSGPPAPNPTGSHPGLTWFCNVTVRFPRRYAFQPASQLQVGQWQGWIRSLGLPIEERTTVHGHPALVKVERVGAVNVIQVRSISWREDDQTFVVTSTSGLSVTAAHSRAVLTAAELVRIADGFRVSTAPTPAGNHP